MIEPVSAYTPVPPIQERVVVNKLLKPFRCFSSVCLQTLNCQLYQYLESKFDICPLCNCKGGLVPLEIIHLLIEDRKGIIAGSQTMFQGNKRFSFACGDANKRFRGLPLNHPDYPRHYTIEPAATTCLECLSAFGQSLTDSMLEVHKR